MASAPLSADELRAAVTNAIREATAYSSLSFAAVVTLDGRNGYGSNRGSGAGR